MRLLAGLVLLLFSFGLLPVRTHASSANCEVLLGRRSSIQLDYLKEVVAQAKLAAELRLDSLDEFFAYTRLRFPDADADLISWLRNHQSKSFLPQQMVIHTEVAVGAFAGHANGFLFLQENVETNALRIGLLAIKPPLISLPVPSLGIWLRGGGPWLSDSYQQRFKIAASLTEQLGYANPEDQAVVGMPESIFPPDHSRYPWRRPRYSIHYVDFESAQKSQKMLSAFLHYLHRPEPARLRPSPLARDR